MKLKFIFGKPGSGKTTYCINKLLQLQDKKEDEGYLIYIIPEQFSMESEKEIIQKNNGKSLIKTQVLSFQRLAYHVIAETGGAGKDSLEEIGKNMLLRKVIYELKDRLLFFNSNNQKQGFIENLSEIITEFYQYKAEIKTLKEISENTENQVLKYKLHDLCLIYERYVEYQEDNYLSSDNLLDLLANKISESNFVKNSIVFIDSFTGFTSQEFEIIKRLMVVSKEVNVALSLEAYSEELVKPNYFYEIRKTAAKLTEIAKDLKVEIDNPVILEDCKGKTAEARHLQSNYLSNLPMRYMEEVERIKIAEVKNIYEEVEFTAANIIKLIREEGYRYKDIAVLTSNLEEYDKIISSVFSKSNIPAFIDAKAEIISNPLIELVRSSLDILSSNWSYGSVFRFLKTGLTDIETEDIDIIENYVLAKGIKGKRWFSEWEYGFGMNYEVFEKKKINLIREEIINSLKPLTEKFSGNKKYKVIDISTAIFKLMDNMRIYDKLNTIIVNLSENNLLKAKEYLQTWNKFVEASEKITGLLKDEKITIDEYREILEAGLLASDIGLIPPSADQVIIGDLKRTRLPHVKVLFILGALEGKLPSAEKDEGLLSEDERELLEKAHNLNLKSYGIYKMYEEQFLIYNGLSKPDDYLFISYYLGGLDGKSYSPSMVIKKICHMFPKLKIQEISDHRQEIPFSPQWAFDDLIEKVGYFFGEGEMTEYYESLFSYFLGEDNYKDKLYKAVIYANAFENNIYLDEKSLDMLYDKKINVSASRLEKYARCPFSYFASYNLELKERKFYEVENIDLGNLFHDALDNFSKLLVEENIDWRNAESHVISGLADKSIDKSLDKEENDTFKNTGQYRYFAKRAKNIALKSIDVIIDHMRKGGFEFAYSEAAFGSAIEDEFEPVEISMDDGRKFILSGKIDRVDFFQNDEGLFVKIIDYKSGNISFNLAEIFYGLQLQLIMYLDAFIKKFKEKNPEHEKVFPGAALYFKVGNPMLNFDKPVNNEDIERAMEKEYKMSGAVIDNREVIKNLDNSFDSISNIIPVGLLKGKKGMTFETRPYTKRGTSVLDNEDFEKLMDYVSEKAYEIGKEILSGNVSISPVMLNNKKGCDYCQYKAICKFEQAFDYGDYRIKDKISDEEAIEKMTKS